MILSKNTWHAKIYKFIYEGSNGIRFPNSLCPYFWKVVVATMLAPIFFILGLPVYTAMLVTKNNRDTWNLAIVTEVIMGIIAYIISYVIFAMTTAVIIQLSSGIYNEYWFGVYTLGCLLWISAGIVLLVIGIKYLIKRVSFNKEYTEKEPNILKEFIKAKYNKYCPKIDWK
jgi:cytochrome c oxidase assembly factor CtaG